MDDQPATVTKRLYCNQCGSETNHTQRCSHSRHDEIDEGRESSTTTVTLWTCAGCDTGVMETEWAASPGIAFDEEPTRSYDPPRATSHHNQKTFRKIPARLRVIYSESVRAFNSQLNTLAAAGLRAMVEGICADKGVQGKNLEKKIDGLEAHLPKAIVSNLHGFRFIGNEAVHELKTPKRQDLKVALEVSEDLLNFLYDLDYRASMLPKGATPPPGAA